MIGSILAVFLLLIVMGVLIWGVQQLLPLLAPYIPPPIMTILHVLLVIVIVLIIVYVIAGLLGVVSPVRLS
jgi:hypothetical protein